MPILLALYSYSLILSYAYTSSFSCFFCSHNIIWPFTFLIFELDSSLSNMYYFQCAQYLFLLALFVGSFESIQFPLFEVHVLLNVNYTYYTFLLYQIQ